MGALLWYVRCKSPNWATAVIDEAKNQTFNYNNGYVFTWKSLWKLLCEVFDVEFVAFDEDE